MKNELEYLIGSGAVRPGRGRLLLDAMAPEEFYDSGEGEWWINRLERLRHPYLIAYRPKDNKLLLYGENLLNQDGKEGDS